MKVKSVPEKFGNILLQDLMIYDMFFMYFMNVQM